MKKIVSLFILLIIVSCSKKADLTATQILDKAIEVSGKEKLSKSTIQFTSGGIKYKSMRDENEYRYEMISERDTTTYIAAVFNGGFEYTANGKPFEYTGIHTQVERQILTMNGFMEIPAIFKGDNSIALTKKPTVHIDNIPYHLIEVNYESLMPTDLVETYYLYINQDNFVIDYIGYALTNSNGYLFFQEAFNERMVDGILFHDYRGYRTKTPTHLDSLPSLFRQNDLKIQKGNLFEDISIEYNK